MITFPFCAGLLEILVLGLVQETSDSIGYLYITSKHALHVKGRK